ncbi:dGTP triphosphohydrolase [Natronoflexus pectinivorans]|uniref:dGTPase n=1 Tax=Natronoflexus pectinivorans TaxID=682526 RepID=A0A4R2GQS3_9BACT|nr:dNTP triphosphohydrolase [Natronoflexus pectinivorans]TCO11099.1 dGTPase [Natronoflexus pectinivorans]
MNWNQLLSSKRTGETDSQKINHDRTQFQRDYDRLIFSSPFRRMQDKTQVFPLPGSIFVHNRLTHSLEVASVGRSLGNNISRFLSEKNIVQNPLVKELGAVTAAACLAHDMGNPPFGHSGEKAISLFFESGHGVQYKNLINNESVWNDFIDFEGNANALRLLTHQFAGRRRGGFNLTYTTVAAIVKYPYASGTPQRKKYGYFQPEHQTWQQIVSELGIRKISGKPEIYARHPLVYLVEAADDICYHLMDIEDAHKLGILSTETTREHFMQFFDANSEKESLDYIQNICCEVTDANEQIAFLRALVIGKLVDECSRIFRENHEQILQGEFNGSLIGHLNGTLATAMKACEKTGYENIYKHPSVVEIEIAGFKILGTLLHEFCHAVMHSNDYYAKLLLPFIPQQYRVADNAPVPQKLQTVLDFISGMTDVYALNLYRKINGMGLSDKR